MACCSYELLAGLTALLLLIYYYSTSTFNFWRSRGVRGPKPIPVFGNFKDIILGRTSMGDYFTELYHVYKDEAMFGVFSQRTPELVVKDPEYIKDVLIKDFTTFADRGMFVDEKKEPLSQHLFSLEPARWRPLRTKLSPVFTSGKLKEMFYLLSQCADHFEHFLEETVQKSPVIDCRDLTAKFTTDVIGICAFGLEMNSLAKEESPFRSVGRKIFEVNSVRFFMSKLRDAIPWLFHLLRPIFSNQDGNKFFINSMRETMEHRKKTGLKRGDFVDLLMEIRDNPSKVGDIEMTDSLITSQAFIFFIAGFETSSSTMCHALYELALNQSIQDKLREEINEELEKDDGKLKYESIKNMKYMNKVFCETLRKFPVVTVLMRNTTEPYTFRGSKVTIPKGTKVWIPVYAIQRDPQIYPDPETFDPERFDEENMKQRHPSFYLPFGDGPRNCIGARFANYQSKVGLVKILKNYKVDVCDETCIPYVNDPRAFMLSPIGGIKLKFTKIK